MLATVATESARAVAMPRKSPLISVGWALVTTAVQQARLSGVELLVLTVTDNNRRACALYERAGFLTYGIEPDAIRVGGCSFGKQHMYLQLAPVCVAEGQPDHG